MEKKVICTDSLFQKLHKPGLWVVKSMRPCWDISHFIYEMVYKGGMSVDIFSTNKKEIQNEVVAMISQDCIDNASDENERNWLEQEMAEFNTHGFFWHPEEMNDYVGNGSFWSHYAIIKDDNLLIHSNCVHSIALVDSIERLWVKEEKDIPRIITEIDSDAKVYKKSAIVFLSESQLRWCVFAGAHSIYGENLSEEIVDRINYELDVIKDSAIPHYEGSLVAYCLGLTEIDPLKHDLMFETIFCSSTDGTRTTSNNLNVAQGQEKVKYIIPCMEKYLEETNGILAYMDQIMMLSRLLADFSREESYRLCRALSNRQQDALIELKQMFLDGGLKNGHKADALEEVWAEWEEKGPFLMSKAEIKSLDLTEEINKSAKLNKI